MADDVLARCREFDGVVLFVASGKVTYPDSAYMPSWDYGEFDPPGYFIPRCRELGLEIYPWWAIGVAPQDAAFRSRYPGLDLALLPEVPDDFHWLDFRQQQAKQLIANVFLEIVERYNPTGVLLDGIRWEGGSATPGWHWSDVRTPDDVTDTVAYIRDAVDAPVVASVMAWNFGASHGQMWSEWLDAGIVDRVFPLNYIDRDESAPYYANLDFLTGLMTEDWLGLDRERVIPTLKCFSGDGPTRRPKTVEELQDEVALVWAWGASGISWFDEKRLRELSIDAIQYINELNDGGIMAVIDELTGVVDALNAEADTLDNLEHAEHGQILRDQATVILAQIVALQDVDAALDAAADVIEVG